MSVDVSVGAPAAADAADRRATVGAVVVTYHSAEHIGRCVASLRADGIDEVVVVDNASTDDTVARAETAGATVIARAGNAGFGAAANEGARALATDVIVVSNPDVWFEPGVVGRLVAMLAARPDVGVVGPRVVYPDGRRYPSARRFPDPVTGLGHAVIGFVRADNPFTRRYRLDDEPAGPTVVDWVSGTFLAARREAWEAVGGFDPAYFMFAEDVDLGWRLDQAGWKVGYVPDVEVVHAVGQSTDRVPFRMIYAHRRSLLRFLARTWRGPRRALLPLVAAGLAAHGAATAARYARDRRSPWRSG